MSKVVAINALSAETVKSLQEAAVKEEMKSFVANDPEVREMLISRVREIISGMSNWDVSYHSAFKERTGEILQQGALDELLRDKITQAARSSENNDVNYRIYEALGEHLAGKLTINIGK